MSEKKVKDETPVIEEAKEEPKPTETTEETKEEPKAEEPVKEQPKKINALVTKFLDMKKKTKEKKSKDKQAEIFKTMLKIKRK